MESWEGRKEPGRMGMWGLLRWALAALPAGVRRYLVGGGTPGQPVPTGTLGTREVPLVQGSLAPGVWRFFSFSLCLSVSLSLCLSFSLPLFFQDDSFHVYYSYPPWLQTD